MERWNLERVNSVDGEGRRNEGRGGRERERERGEREGRERGERERRV
jgi:hypothetical protein